MRIGNFSKGEDVSLFIHCVASCHTTKLVVSLLTGKDVQKKMSQNRNAKSIYLFLMGRGVQRNKINEETQLDRVTDMLRKGNPKRKGQQLVKSQVLLSGGE